MQKEVANPSMSVIITGAKIREKNEGGLYV